MPQDFIHDKTFNRNDLDNNSLKLGEYENCIFNG